MEAERHLSDMQAKASSPTEAALLNSLPRSISAEWLAYCALALLALLLRVSMLDDVPVTDFEAQQSLHAWHTVEDDAPGGFVTASSPLTYLTQLVTFSLAGADEFNARIGSALAGFALAMTPLLFRDSLGVTRTFVWAVLLSFLTVPLATSRSADGTSFMLLFTIVAVWMIRRYWYSKQLRDAHWAIAFITFMLLLSSPSGLALFVVLIVSGWLAVWRTALSAPQRLDLPGDDILQLAVKRLQAFPFVETLIVPVIIVVAGATFFMLNPAGLSTVGQLIESSLSGITQSNSTDGARLGFAVLLFHEPLLFVFAGGGAWLLWRHGDVTYIDRFAAAWAAIGTVGLLLYPGARAADAMWVVLPLTLLASYGITQLMVNRRVVVLWSNSDADNDEEDDGMIYTTQYWWVKWAISAGVLLCLFILSVQFMQVARLLSNVPAGASIAEVIDDASQLRLWQGMGLLFITAIICIVVFLLVANFWGLGTCLQGTGIGFLWLMLLSGVGGAWQASVANADYPDGLWRKKSVTRDAYLLRDTLYELADRDSLGFPAIDITVVTDERGFVRDTGLVAWLVRDFPNARFVGLAAAAAGEQIVIMAENEALTSDLAGDYVGQRLVLRRTWSLADLDIWDLAAWWSLGRLDRALLVEDAAMLWLRQDVYDGVPQVNRP